MVLLKIKYRAWAIIIMALLMGAWLPAAAEDNPTVQPVLAAVSSSATYDWTGPYAGLFAGGAFGSRAKARELGASPGGLVPTGTLYNSSAPWGYKLHGSFTGGVQFGYNFQITPFVLGLENEVGYLGLKGAKKQPASPGGDTSSRTKVGDWFDVLAARFGFALDRALFYGKGGVAFTEASSRARDNCVTAPCGPGTIEASRSKFITTWALGGGLEYAVTNNWTVKGEYLFIDLDESYTAAGPGGGTAAGSNFRFKHNVAGLHTIIIGVNYKF